MLCTSLENGYDVSAPPKPTHEENPMETIRTENVTLQVADGTSMNAFVATPAEGTKAPGLLVFQEAFGVNAHIRDVADEWPRPDH